MKLWSKQPAKEWTEALPVGNGRLGAMVFGRTDEERIQLNEETLWSGGPYDPSVPGAHKALPEIRRLVFEGKYMQAHTLFARKMMGYPVEQMKYQPLGNLILKFPRHHEVTNYRRELDLDRAITTVSYRVDDVSYTREVFSSPVDQVLVVRLTANRPRKISFVANLQGVRNPDHSNYGTDYFQMNGEPPNGLRVTGKSTDYLGIKGQLRYLARLKAFAAGGNLTVNGIDLIVSNADTVTLVFAAATNFINYHDVSGNPEGRVREYFDALRGKPYEKIKEDHIAEHRRLFRRVGIDLGGAKASTLPTDERIKNFARNNDPQLAALYYQFGRYLLISSSRPGTQPANLQGIWNQDSNPWWDSKCTTNINLEMNYWPAEAANLSECVEPLTTLAKEIAEGPGGRIAQRHYAAKGWVFHQNTDLWRAAAPMDGPTWGTFSTGGAWLCTHLWDHYQFTGDTKYLRTIYPILKGSAEFFLSTLVEEPTHKWLVTNPSTSPENFPMRDGNQRYYDEITGLYLPGTSICAGSTIDMSILRALFAECIEAAGILGTDKEFKKKLGETRARLAPLQIGKGGELQEWLQDWESLEPQHRHLSHLWGLFPGDEITPRSTPRLVEAARKSLIHRGDGASGWSMGWKVNLWARLLDGEHAWRLFTNLVTENTFPNMFSRGGKALQVDGDFGGASGLAEMLLQSHSGEVYLLPALPKALSSGVVRGMRARGGFEIDMTWSDGKLKTVIVRSLLGNVCKIRYGDKLVKLKTEKAKSYTLNGELKTM